MCGIAGIVDNKNRPVDETALRNMTDRLRHRGPDDGGVRVVPGPAGSGLCAGLGHRRLSIIDLSPLGRQPMANEDESVWITFNGEIYNYIDLREDLVSKGHRFRSRSDTEVIVHGYEEYGAGVCEKLSGMFAFAVWDAPKGRLLLARDRFGKKPLYYRQTSSGISFASEPKAFFALPGFAPELDREGLALYLAFEYVPVPNSIYCGIYKLPPGSYAVFENGTLSISSYWDILFPDRLKKAPSLDEAARSLLDHLKSSVRKRLMSDVALGVFLSGGIDSSAVVAMMCEIMEPKRIKTFSIGFEDASYDESTHARRVARFFGTDHHERTFTAQDMVALLPEVWGFLDEPFADASVLPTFMLSRFTRETVTVALGGDGGDELFAGYDPFLAHFFADIYAAVVPGWLTKAVVSPLASLIPVSSHNMSFDFRIKQFLKGVNAPLPERNQRWLGAFPPDEQGRLFSRTMNESLGGFDPFAAMNRSLEGRAFRDWADETAFLYQRWYLGEDILTKVDRASMAVSLEARTPFLDADLSEFANALPSRYKLHWCTRKYILKKAFEHKLPRDILYRKKKGFGIPLTKWLRYDLRPLLEKTFAKERMEREGLFSIPFVHTLMNEHFNGKRDNRKQLWVLLMFEQWKERFCPG
jgi:asparagine synthase (glutamine-hydrolysing)